MAWQIREASHDYIIMLCNLEKFPCSNSETFTTLNKDNFSTKDTGLVFNDTLLVYYNILFIKGQLYKGEFICP